MGPAVAQTKYYIRPWRVVHAAVNVTGVLAWPKNWKEPSNFLI